MTRLLLTVVFSASCVAGFAMIVYAAISRRDRRAPEHNVALCFSDSPETPAAGILDLDIGHEGLKHREKEPFNPEKHKPEPIESRKKIP